MTEEKLDLIIEKLHEMHVDLKVHVAEDEAVWKRVAENEDEIKDLVKDNGKVKTKLAVVTATIAGAAASLPHLLKALL